MPKIKGYKIEEIIYESNKSLIYRALKTNDNTPVVIKQYNNKYPTTEEISKFNQEYELTKMFTNEGGIRAYEMSKVNDSPAIIMEDVGGQSLTDILKSRKLNLDEFLCASMRIAGIVGNIHNRNIIHKDINSSNIIWNTEKDIFRILDFGIATELSREITSVKNPEILEGSLAYISPEQTGRMNCSVDYRTDFYSLGVTFYWMLTGRLPFESKDLLELVHSHIAIQPTPPHEIDENIPEAISAIVMKLMNKNAGDRYQNAYGLKADLERCLKEFRSAGTIKTFELGQKDVSDQFHISQKLYGREQEIEILMSAFERTREDDAELVLVSGFSGIGKSMLINEIHRPMVKHKGCFISGKFERDKKYIPYNAIVQAFTGLAKQILAEGDDKIAEWKEHILSVLGPNGKIISDIIPLFELIIGKQPEVPLVGPVESQNRFDLTFQGFIKVLANKAHPLVIFLDDLQWADLASLHLLKLFFTDSKIKHLLLMGAYRHNETPDTHPLILTLNEIKTTGAIINNIFLQPLNEEHVSQLLGDTLNCPKEETTPLAELLVHKTRGNPFFINEFLKSLYKKRLIEFSQEHGWSWHIKGIEEMRATDNVVDLMVGKITELPENSQTLLKLGACIGSYFNRKNLVSVCGKSEEAIRQELNEVMQEGMINRIDNMYLFSHDRIMEAAYSLLPDEEKARQHYRIGSLELNNTDKEELQHKIFYIVNQLNAGMNLVKDGYEKHTLAELNLLAGKKALASNAYTSALNYFKTGIGLLNENCWEENYAFTLKIYQEATVAAQLCADYAMMDKFAEEVFQNSQTILDTVKVYEAKIFASVAQNQLLDGIRIGLHVLKKLGIRLPEKPGKLRIVYELLLVKLSLTGKSVKNLINLSEMKDPHQSAVIQILSSIFLSAYLAAPDLLPLIILKAVKLSIKYGNSIYSAYYFAAFGMIHCAVLGNINTGHEWGKLSLSIIEKFNIKESKSRVLAVVWYFINHWKRSLRDSINPLLEGYQIGLETGDLEFAAINASCYSYSLFIFGTKLPKADNEIAKYAETIKKLNQDTILNYHLMLHQTILNLQGTSKNPCKLIGSSYDESKMMPIHKKANDVTAMFYVNYFLLNLNYLFENYKEAHKNAELAKPYCDIQISNPLVPLFNFFDSLTRLALYPAENKSEKKKFLKRITKNQKKMKKWAFHAPMNYSHKYHLVEAEIARIQGQKQKAMDHYKQAVKLSHENSFIQEKALCLKLTAQFWLDQNEEKIAMLYMSEAHHTYRMWGAIAMVKHIEEKYGHLLKLNTKVADSSSKSSIPSATSTSESIDLSTVIKTSQTLSSERDIGRLLERIMKFSIANAGAQRGFLIIENDVNKKLYIEAEGESDKDIKVLESVPVEKNTNLSSTIVNYVNRTGQNIVLNNAHKEGEFSEDPYIKRNKTKSLLCAPITHKGKTSGILYLENNLTKNCFTDNRLALLRILSSQAAISIENARLYEYLEEKVIERTAQLEQANENFKELSLNDPLTSLRNRRYIYEVATELSENFINHQGSLSNNYEKRDLTIKGKFFGVYLIHIDYFKNVNDTYGHQAGDQVLIKISETLKKLIRADDIIARWGGEEFLIILQNTKPEYLKIFSKKVIDTIKKIPLKISDENTIFKTCSIGCAKIPLFPKEPDLLTLDQTIHLCDFALYTAKEKGRNQAVHFELKDQDNIDDKIKHYLLNLSKDAEINNDYINIQYVI